MSTGAQGWDEFVAETGDLELESPMSQFEKEVRAERWFGATELPGLSDVELDKAFGKESR